MLTHHEQLVQTVLHKGFNFQERFIKDSWNSMWTTLRITVLDSAKKLTVRNFTIFNPRI